MYDYLGSIWQVAFCVLCSVSCDQVCAMSGPAWLAPVAGTRSVSHTAAAAVALATQSMWLDPTPGPASAHERKERRVPRVVQAAAAAASAAEAAAQATIVAQALLAEVRCRQPVAMTPRKSRAQRDDPTSSTKVVATRSVRAESCREAVCAVQPATPPALGSAFLDTAAEPINGSEEISCEMEVVEQDSDKPLTTPRRPYRPRGTMGTFQGKRPPKNPAKLKEFLAAKAGYEKEKNELRATRTKISRPTQTQEAYRTWQRTFDRSRSATSRVAFAEAAAEWSKERARMTAARVAMP